MKKSLSTLICALGLVAGAATLSAQPAPKVYVVDMVKLFEAHYKTAEWNAKFAAEEQDATTQLNKLQAEIDQIETDYKVREEQIKNPILKDDVKAKTQAEMQNLLAVRQNKISQGTSYRAQVQQGLQKRIADFRTLLLDEIGRIAERMALQKGATLLFDKSGVTVIGMRAIVFSDPAYDITDEVMAEIAKSAPPPAPAPAAAAAPAAAPAAPAKK